MTTRKMLEQFSFNNVASTRLGSWLFWLAVFVVTLAAGPKAQAQDNGPACTTEADVVVFDSPTVFNRLGAQNPNWIQFALKRDVVHKSGTSMAGQVCQNADGTDNGCTAGNVELRPDKRPRPLVLRSVEGECLRVNFTNWLAGPGQSGNHPSGANPNNAQQGENAPQGDNVDPDWKGLFNDDQVVGRCAGFHATGTELKNSIGDDGSFVGANHFGNDVNANCTGPNIGEKGSLVGPNGTWTYELITPHEGAYIITSYGALLGSEASGGNLAVGMFGALNVQPKGADFYRSQVTEEEMRLATVKNADGTLKLNPGDCPVDNDGNVIGGVLCDRGGQPVINYEATYPALEYDPDTESYVETVWAKEGKAGLPILRMRTPGGRLVHSDINAIIVGPNTDGTFPETTYPLESVGKNNPQYPNRLEPFREFTSQFHDEQTNSQVYPRWFNDPVLGFTLAGVRDAFMINYGSGGIGSEIISNRLHTGPMHDCTDCAYEEFFLSSSTVGDPATLVKWPANSGIEACDPTAIAGPSCWRDPVNLANGPVAFPETDIGGNIVLTDGQPNMIPVDNYALYQEDPSNVHHAYINDYTKIRNTHAGAFEQHIFHLHNQQWQFNPSDDNSNYLDAQEIHPGSGHTYEIVNGGAGNRNKTSGDAIFHCHFYPHFAQGMWYHIRIKEVFETGTVLAVSNADDPQKPTNGFHTTPWALRSGKPAPGSRALPDGELPDGVPIPAIVPLPGKGMPEMPAKVQVAAVDRGSHSLLGGRGGPDGKPDSSQAFVDRESIKGVDGILGTPDDVSPGYPFWLAGNECGPDGKLDDPETPNIIDPVCPQGIVGQRMPTPPLDMLTEAGAVSLNKQAGPEGMWRDVSPSQAGGWDGGLPRHSLLGYVSGGMSKDTQNRLDFQKIVEIAPPVYFPEVGTDLEQLEMRIQQVRNNPAAAQQLAGNDVDHNKVFIMNGAPPVPGGPFQDPCVDDAGNRLLPGHIGYWYDGDGTNDPTDETTLKTRGASEFHSQNPRTYRIANIQIDAVFNKVGYHYPQERIIALWGDVEPTINKQRPPEPLVMRFNTFDCGKLLHSNLTPHEYEVDDFQVRTPTDIIGQHIHLPKWDLTTNDGAANGWNYEDGALAPGMVRERIAAINRFNFHAGNLVGPNCTLAAAIAANFKETATCPIPGQIAPIDLRGVAKVPTINTGDPGASYMTVDPDTGLPEAVPTTALAAAEHPYFGGQAGNPQANEGMYLGARTVIQRILVDPVVNVQGIDRGLGLTFSHDHYGPSTFQQIGLYSTILAEPAGSTWVHNESGETLYGRGIDDGCGTEDNGQGIQVPRKDCTDGGPTSWQAAILPPEAAPLGSNVSAEKIRDHREFYFEMSDFQHAYEPGVYIGADANGIPKHYTIKQAKLFDATLATVEEEELQNSWRQTVNPPLKLKSVPFPDIVTANHLCPGPLADANGNPIPGSATNASIFAPRPCAEAINLSHSSMWVVNYRNEPIGLRVFDPNQEGPDGKGGAQTAGQAGDLALAFQSRRDRALPQLNTSLGDTPYPTPDYCSGPGDGINCDRQPGDPFTPIMRAYEFDDVKIKVQVGATEEQHQTTFHGLKWLSNGSGFGRSPNSGWRNFQSHGISEQFTLQMPIIPDRRQRGPTVDYLYAQDATRDGIWTGTWGIIRSYKNKQSDLFELPENVLEGDIQLVDEGEFQGVCPKYATDYNGNFIIDSTIKGKDKRKLAPVRQFNVYAVKANDVLPNNLNVDIRSHDEYDPQFPTTKFGQQVVGASPDPTGGTLVYNRRTTVVPGVNAEGEDLRGGQGPLNDPTALMYVREEDLVPRFIKDVSYDVDGWVKVKGKWTRGPDGVDDRCQIVKDKAGEANPALWTAGCPVMLDPEAPVEPMVIRANAGDCIEVTLLNKLVDQATANNKPVYNTSGLPIFDEREMLKALDAYGYGLVDKDLVHVDAADVVFDGVPDLAGWQDLFWVVNREMFNGDGTIRPPEQRRCTPDPADPENPAKFICEMHFFNNNLIAPSAWAGLHAQLVEYDASRHDGTIVGQNGQNLGIAVPGGRETYRWYAGHIDIEYIGPGGNNKNPTREFRRTATPVEFGPTNLLSSDRIKQPQKGLYGALIIEPVDATYPDALADLESVPDGQGTGAMTRKTRAQVNVSSTAGGAGSGGDYREAVSVAYRIANMRWADGTAIANIHQGELGREGAEDSGHAGFNYGTEPSWFRFGMPPDSPFGNAGAAHSFGSIENMHAFYANGLTLEQPGTVDPDTPNLPSGTNFVPDIDGVAAMGDPATPVFRYPVPGQAGRMHLLNGASADRDSVFVLHGHVWQRAPYVCPHDSHLGLEGKCVITGPGSSDGSVPSQALGLNPLGKYLGAEEGMGHVFGHWPILFKAGGTNSVEGDYLFRDYAPSGGRNGMFGLMRVGEVPVLKPTDAGSTGGGN